MQAQNLDVTGVKKFYTAQGLVVLQETVTSTLWFTLKKNTLKLSNQWNPTYFWKLLLSFSTQL